MIQISDLNTKIEARGEHIWIIVFDHYKIPIPIDKVDELIDAIKKERDEAHKENVGNPRI